jgi:rod shape-determining protein MreC
VHTQKNKIFKALVVAAVLALLIANSKSITSSFRTNLSDPNSALLKTFLGIRDGLKKIMPFAGLREENRILRQRIELLNRRVEEAQFFRDENLRLRDLLDFKKTLPFSTVSAQVIGRDPSNWSNSLIIDKGASNDVRQSRAVLSTKGLVGRVLEAGRVSARVLLVTDPNSKVGVLIQRNRQGGILVGRPDGTCKVIYIALDADIRKGDRVITAGLGTVFPKGILVGEVIASGKEPGMLYKYAIVKTSQDMSKLEEVLCIK